MTATFSMARVNDMDRATFAEVFGQVYEESRWVAESAWEQRPFADRAALANAMEQIVRAAGSDQVLALFRAHPRLGIVAPMSDYSREEQAGAGLRGRGAATEEDRIVLAKLNDDYEAKFSFPFIIAVRGHTPASIIEACSSRLSADREPEIQQSLEQVCKIAGLRLADLIEK
ncbi:MAG: 2-oxo-4-hydroxy-4-carboxy-5-ureidoimidazoline decarboxylase [Gammaproteobacteria bacterium]|nr:2-oxo-4-hydroxy-4-carboxy-5-ureidoimidazoline decarboxylase [Gammaproteobacteria bacterium]